MPPKVSFWLLLRLAVLLAVLLIQSGEGARYQDFRQRHIDHPKTRANNPNAYCDLMMRRRGLSRRRCKPTNTFINSNPRLIQNICRGGGTRVPRTRNLFDSRSRFPVVVCRNTGRFPNCRYNGRQHNRRIRVGCVNRLPVHFAGLR